MSLFYLKPHCTTVHAEVGEVNDEGSISCHSSGGNHAASLIRGQAVMT